MKYIIVITCYILVHFPVVMYAQDRSTPNEYSPENILQYSRYLAKKNDYYRAYLELLRLQSFYPGYITPRSACISQNYLLFRGQQYLSIINSHSSDNHVCDTHDFTTQLFMFDSFLMLHDSSAVSQLLIQIDKQHDQRFFEFFFKRKIVSLLLLQEHEKLNSFLAEYNTEKFEKYRELSSTVLTKMRTDKSPGVALMLGIVPGLGYAYSGRVKTGLIAFFLCTINAVATYYAFETGNKTTGFFIGAIGLFFYTGSIAGGYLQTKKYNTQNKVYNSNLLFRELELENDQDYMVKKYGIGYE